MDMGNEMIYNMNFKSLDEILSNSKVLNKYRIMAILGLSIEELEKASSKFPKFASDHEGYAVLLEEVDEMWDEIKKNNKVNTKMECIQVIAMAIRLLHDMGE